MHTCLQLVYSSEEPWRHDRTPWLVYVAQGGRHTGYLENSQVEDAMVVLTETC